MSSTNRMHLPRLLSVAFLLPGIATAQQDVGRGLNWQTPSAPNYRAPSLPEKPPPTTEYQLPSLPEDALAGTKTIASAGTVLVRDIRVDGVTAFSQETVDSVTAPYENRTVTSAELQALRLELTRLYIDKGYVSSGVVLRNQEVKDGVVVFHAIEGTLAAVEILGDPHLRHDYVAGRIHRNVQSPLNVVELQDALRFLQQDPNVGRLDARLAPGAEPGDSVLRVTIDEAPRFHAGLGVDNHRASSTGAEQVTLFGGARNLTGYGDELRVSASLSEGTVDGSAVLSVPVTARNNKFQAYYSRSSADIIEDRFKTLDITSETETWGATFTVPVVERLNHRFGMLIGLESKNSKTELLGVPFSFSVGAKNGESKDAVGLLGVDWLNRGESHVAGLQGTYRHGFDAMGATIFDPKTPEEALFNPTGADAVFDLMQAQGIFIRRLNAMSVLQGLSDRAQIVSRATGQFTNDPLLSMEKLAIGGVNTVRGFPENLLVRDNGFAVTLEVQLPVFDYHPEPHPLNLVLVPFTDYGRSWDTRDTAPASDTTNTDQANYIWSAGLGLLWQPLLGLDVQLYWGADIGDNFTASNDPRDYREKDLQDDGLHFAVNYVARW
jgi:hemolysin activation/secretion protein